MTRQQLPSLKRRSPTREPRRRFTLFCEGKNTEPLYFNALRVRLAHALIEIRINKAAGVPYTIAEQAVQLAKETRCANRRRKRDSYEERDQIWAIFDRDEHPRYEEAVALCVASGVHIARSNPCFEIWLILHEQDYDKPDGRQAIQDYLRALRPEYDPNKGKAPNCSELLSRVAEAERRAETQLMRRESEGSPFGSPSTTVFRLTRNIRSAAIKATPRTTSFVPF
jgi:hypothetical protein